MISRLGPSICKSLESGSKRSIDQRLIDSKNRSRLITKVLNHHHQYQSSSSFPTSSTTKARLRKGRSSFFDDDNNLIYLQSQNDLRRPQKDLKSLNLSSSSFKNSKPTSTTTTKTFSPSSSSFNSSYGSSRFKTSSSTIEQYRLRKRLEYKSKNRALLFYTISIGVVTLGLSYAAVPLYRVFCSVTGFGGTPKTINDETGKFSSDRIDGPVGEKTITVRFNADKSDTLDWKFWPCQKSVKVRPGETVLAFYRAKNLSDVDVLGVATYNVTPAQVAPYFAKVECFCFDEQRLLAGEEIDLPIFFFIDKDFVEDPLMRDIDDIVLSYTFFKAKRNSFGQLEPDDTKK